MESSAQVKELALDESSPKSKERGGKTECLGRDTGTWNFHSNCQNF